MILYSPTYIIYSTLPWLSVLQLDLLWQLSILFAFLCLLFVGIVFYLRNKDIRLSRKYKERRAALAPMISTFLFYEQDAEIEERRDYVELKIEIRQLIKDPVNRKVLAEILVDLRNDVSGDTLHRLLHLYRELCLHLDAFEKLESKRWEVVVQGIVELTQMQIAEAHSFILPMINSRKGVIRKQAQLATVSLRQEGINYFLDTAKYRISEWQQLKLLDVIRQFEDFEPPRFKNWLTSANKDVVLFSLRLIKFYKQNDAAAAILKLIRHKNKDVKLEALRCIEEFCLGEAIEPVKRIFWKNPVEIKLQILNVLGSLGSEEDIIFLQEVENKDSNFIIKSKALSSVNQIIPDTMLPSKDIEEDMAAPVPSVPIPDKQHEAGKEEESIISEPQPIPNDIQVTAEIVEPMDESLFAICCREEFEDIKQEFAEMQGAKERNSLSLQFLPIVSEQGDTPFQPPIEETVDFADEDDSQFRLELQQILDNIDLFPVETDKTNAAAVELHFEPVFESLGAAFDSPEESENKKLPEDDSPISQEIEQYHSENMKLGLDWHGFSIFEELFRDTDKHSKLILLDEVLALGSAKDFPLLDTLTQDPEARVRRKATKIRDLLKAALLSEASEIEVITDEDVNTEREPLEFCLLITDEDVDKGGTEKSTEDSSDIQEVVQEIRIRNIEGLEGNDSNCLFQNLAKLMTRIHG